ncbi:unnamed protein product [Meganyctiphanes norvegica]|uniref:carbonyl reductase (NADPH) n=1 Tax=Meganyctiphanes norvegica TaxID=48144 RepID=A0AAV2RTD5_MEGNR
MANTTRVAVVTGANKGIGFGIMKELCVKFEGLVYLTSRDEGRGKAAQQELAKLGLSCNYHQLDITNQASIDKFAAYIKNTYGGFDCLVNNAGFAYKQAATEPVGVQARDTVGINYFGTLAVCKALFPLLRSHARVSNVGSSAGMLKHLNGDEPHASELKKKMASDTITEAELSNLMNQYIESANNGTHRQKGWGSSTYCMSKIGLSALSRIQQRHFDTDPREDLVVNFCHPGYVDTDMSSHKGPLTIEEGAVAAVYLALLPPNITSPKGQFHWFDCKLIDWVTTAN